MTTRPVTLLDVLGAAQAGHVALAPETAGYLTLGEATDILLSESGGVEVLARTPASARSAETAARSMLSQLLSVAGNRAPALSAAAKKRSGSGPASLVAELEAALIPVNRAAAGRTLARLFRETARVRGDALEIPYTPPRSTASLESTHGDLADEHDGRPLEQDASIVIGELSMPITADFDPSIPIATRPPRDGAARPAAASSLSSSDLLGRDREREEDEASALGLGAPAADDTEIPPGRDFRPRRPRARGRSGTYFLAGLVLLGLCVLLWLYLQHPEFFLGHR
jgi:hypothetical protein